MDNRELLHKLHEEQNLTPEQWRQLLGSWTEEDRQLAAELARAVAQARFGRDIFFRGIVEFTNYCKNNCCYCGIRRGNEKAVRYRLTPEEILECCQQGYA